MKNVLLLLSFVAIVSFSKAQTFFSEDFENGGTFPTGWTLDPGTGNDWKIDDGTTSGPGTAQSGTYCAYFDDFSYSTGTVARMITPVIDLSSTSIGDIIILSYWYWDGDGSDQVEVSISTDGTVYIPVDTTGATVDPWTQQFVNLSAYAGQSTVYIAFKGTSIYGYTNPHVDDILVKKVPDDNLTAASVVPPTSYCGITIDTIKMTIVNVGAATQNSYTASYSIDGGTTWITPENISTTLNPDDTLNYVFTTLADFSTYGTYDVVAAVNLAGDADNSNDTVSSSNPVLSKPIISSYPYIQDFEGIQYWSSGGTLSSWELGAPNNIIINSAASGTNAWVTNLTGNYNNNENSYVESPCFDFSTLHNPLVQFNYWAESEGDGTWNYDGARLDYTIDDGVTWNSIGNLGDWINWYNMSSISGLSSDGWGGDGTYGSNGWVEAKHLLTGLAGQPSVKFRIYFGSDGIVNYEGFAFDDFTIREGTVDLAITEINYNGPEVGTDTTEFIEWYNYGQDAVNVNGYYYSQGVIDTLPNVMVLPGDFFVSAYDSTIMANFFGYTGAIQWDSGNLANGGEDIALHTSWGTLVDSVFYDDANGWPTQPDGNGPSLVFCEQNIGLDANDPTNWNISNSFVDTLNGMDVYASPGALDSTCYSWDVAIADLQTGDTLAGCDFSATDTVMVDLVNLGNQPISAGDTIFGWYQLNTGSVVADTFVLNATFNPMDTIEVMFNQTVDLSALGYSSAGLWFNYFNDVENANDSVFITLYHYQPVVNLGTDTIWTTQPDTIVLDAGAGFDSYIWQDTSTAQTFNVATAGTYFVTALDSNDCSASDTIVVVLLLLPPDLAITDPLSGDWYDCNMTANDTAEVLFTNIGGQPVASGDTIYFWYQIDGNPVVADTLVLTSDMNQNDTLPFMFNQTIDFSALTTYTFAIWLNYAGDTIPSNDTVSGTVTHYELSIDLGPDTICTNQPDTVVLDPGTGFDAYLWQDTSTAQTFNVNTYGTYFVQVYDTNWCDATDTIVIDNCVGIEENDLSGISIYPNPNDGQFVIDLPDAEKTNIEVLTINGQVVYTKQSVDVHNVINLKTFDKGIYFVRITNHRTVANYKIVVQ